MINWGWAIFIGLAIFVVFVTPYVVKIIEKIT